MELSIIAPNQIFIQRVVSLPSLTKGTISMVLAMTGAAAFIVACGYIGLQLHTVYQECDPVIGGMIEKYDQLVPLLIMKLHHVRGLPGLFAAGMFSASLSTVSSFLNSMSATLAEDFYKGFFKNEISDRHTKIFMRITVLFLGCSCALMVLVVEKLSTVTQLTITFMSVANCSLLSMFIMGIFIPRITPRGAFIGALTGTVLVSWIGFGAQAAIATGSLHYETKPLPMDGCNVTLTTFIANATVSSSGVRQEDVFMLYKISYLWLTFVGVIVSLGVALIVSMFTARKKYDAKLIHPSLRWMLAPKYKSSLAQEMKLLK